MVEKSQKKSYPDCSLILYFVLERVLGTNSLYSCSFPILSNNIIEAGYDKGCLFSPGSTSHGFLVPLHFLI